MNRYRKSDEAVSPVIATILMVAITVVLAGVLVAYLQDTRPDGNPMPKTVGVKLEKNSQGDWMMTIIQGSTKAYGVNIQVKNPDAGTLTVSGELTASSSYYVFNDNTQQGTLNAGDSIRLNRTANYVQPGYTVALLQDNAYLVAERVLD